MYVVQNSDISISVKLLSSESFEDINNVRNLRASGAVPGQCWCCLGLLGSWKELEEYCFLLQTNVAQSRLNMSQLCWFVGPSFEIWMETRAILVYSFFCNKIFLDAAHGTQYIFVLCICSKTL